MLVLTSRKGDSVCLGDDIEIVVMGFAENRARIGIQAPKSVRVTRKRRDQAEQEVEGAGGEEVSE